MYIENDYDFFYAIYIGNVIYKIYTFINFVFIWTIFWLDNGYYKYTKDVYGNWHRDFKM